jgi:hypothetical protein
LRQSFREKLQARKGTRFNHIVKQITARMPTADETKQLAMPKAMPLLPGSARPATPPASLSPLWSPGSAVGSHT